MEIIYARIKSMAKFYKLTSDGLIRHAFAIPADHPVIGMLLKHIHNLEVQNKLLCKIVGPKIARDIKKKRTI